MEQIFNQTPIRHWSCRFHPDEWFHEVGCHHKKWSMSELKKALTILNENPELNIWKIEEIEKTIEHSRKDK